MYVAGIETLYDDRPDQTAGVKFNDSDLLGLPIRLVVSPRNLRDGVVEIRGRADADAATTPLDGIIDAVRARLAGGKPRRRYYYGQPRSIIPDISVIPDISPSFPRKRESIGVNAMLDFGTMEIQPAAIMRRGPSPPITCTPNCTPPE